MMTRTLLLSLSLFVLIAAATAQETKLEKPKPSFRVLALNEIPPRLHYQLGENNVAIVAPQDFRSPFYETPAAETLEFFTLEPLADGEFQRKPVVKVAIAPGLAFGLVLLQKTDQGVSARMLDDGPKVFPGGSYRVINMLAEEVGVLIAKQPHVVPASGEKVIEAKPAGEGRTVFFQLYQLANKDRRLLFSNNWAFNNLLRTLVVIAPPSPPSPSPGVRRIAEPLDALNLVKTPPSQP